MEGKTYFLTTEQDTGEVTKSYSYKDLVDTFQISLLYQALDNPSVRLVTLSTNERQLATFFPLSFSAHEGKVKFVYVNNVLRQPKSETASLGALRRALEAALKADEEEPSSEVDYSNVQGVKGSIGKKLTVARATYESTQDPEFYWRIRVLEELLEEYS